MKVRWAWALAALIVTASSGVADDPVPDQPEPPVRLKKKEKPKEPEAADQKPAPPAADKPAKPPEAKEKPSLPREPREPQEPAQDPEKEAAEILARVGKNVRATEERLGQQDAGEGTRQLQRDIVKDLDSLIEQTKRRQQQQQQRQQQQQQNASNSRERGGQQTARSQQEQRQQQAAARMQAQGRQPREQQAKDQNQGGMGGQGQRDAMNKLADLYKEVWGHLPEGLRQEMDQYAREQFMAKYSDLLKQYYTTIAEKGHRKGE